MTHKGQSHDPDIFGANYLESGWRYGLGANGAPIGNDYLGIKWSRDVISYVTIRIPMGHFLLEVHCHQVAISSRFRDIWLNAKYLENGWR